MDQFDHWPEDSKKNKDLLYGNARKIISQQYTGVGDVYVPIQRCVCVCVCLPLPLSLSHTHSLFLCYLQPGQVPGRSLSPCLFVSLTLLRALRRTAMGP